MKSHIAASASAAVLAVVSVVCGAEPESPPDWQPYFRELARSYRITPRSAPDEPLTLHEPPVLRWTQPVRGGDDGALYVWLKDGEPAVVGTMFCWPHAAGYRVVVNEFHSLLTEPLTAVRGGEVAWAPEQGGITWKPFKEAPAPGGTAAQRLLQMRRLANRFRGENLDDDSDQTWEAAPASAAAVSVRSLAEARRVEDRHARRGPVHAGIRDRSGDPDPDRRAGDRRGRPLVVGAGPVFRSPAHRLAG